jgi:hypothetical protein
MTIDRKKLKYNLRDRWYNFIFIDLDCLEHNLKVLDPARVQKAKDDAAGSNHGVLPGLKSTESNHKWVLLYDHAREVQLRPWTLHRMFRRDLEYLAGMAFAHPELAAPNASSKDYEQLTKLQGNATRAQNVLKMRNLIWAAVLAAPAAILAAVLAT